MTAEIGCKLLEQDGSPPVRVVVRDVTPAGHATPLHVVVLDYGWAESILLGPGYEWQAEAVALIVADAFGVPCETL